MTTINRLDIVRSCQSKVLTLHESKPDLVIIMLSLAQLWPLKDKVIVPQMGGNGHLKAPGPCTFLFRGPIS